MRIVLVAATLAAGCLVTACADGSGPEEAVSRVDSVGIEVVTNHTLEVPEWSLSETPRLALGSLDGEPYEQLYRVRDATVLSDGSVAVLNGGSQEIRIFDAQGGYVRSLGSEGDGPGELRNATWVEQLEADTLAVWDVRSRRITLFSSQGALGRSYAVEAEAMPAAPVTVLSDGRMIVGGPWVDPNRAQGFTPFEARYSLVGPEGEFVDALPPEPGGVLAFVGDTWVTRLFTAETSAAGDNVGYWVGTGEREEVVRFAPDGVPTRIVRWPATDREVRPEDVELNLQEALDEVEPRAQERVRRIHEARRPAADRFPAYAEIGLDEDGWLWVREYERPGHDGPQRWMVFDADGALSGHVEVPQSFRMLEAGEDYVLGVHTDELDVEYVQIRSLARRGSG